jgi:hypothetical protein
MQTVMSREEALPKLLALGPMTFAEMFEACGWPSQELLAVIGKLHDAGKVTWFHFDRQRWYVPGQSTRKSGARKCAR